jgi:uncharacterized membrane protein YdjX (TVP38/TMEM64 family)
MEKPVEQIGKNSSQALLKFLALIAFIIVCVCLFRFTPVKDYLKPDVLDLFLKTFGPWAPFIFILIFAVGLCVAVPASILTLLGAGIFGAYWGFLYAWVGAVAGASGAFFIGRTLGRDFVGTFIGDRLKKYDDAIERNGFATVLYLRLLNTPFMPMNFGIGLTRVGFRDYLFGTGLGIMVSFFFVAFLGGTMKEVWVSGNWGELVSFKVFLALALFVVSIFIPMIIKKIQLKN